MAEQNSSISRLYNTLRITAPLLLLAVGACKTMGPQTVSSSNTKLSNFDPVSADKVCPNHISATLVNEVTSSRLQVLFNGSVPGFPGSCSMTINGAPEVRVAQINRDTFKDEADRQQAIINFVAALSGQIMPALTYASVATGNNPYRSTYTDDLKSVSGLDGLKHLDMQKVQGSEHSFMGVNHLTVQVINDQPVVIAAKSEISRGTTASEIWGNWHLENLHYTQEALPVSALVPPAAPKPAVESAKVISQRTASPEENSGSSGWGPQSGKIYSGPFGNFRRHEPGL